MGLLSMQSVELHFKVNGYPAGSGLKLLQVHMGFASVRMQRCFKNIAETSKCAVRVYRQRVCLHVRVSILVCILSSTFSMSETDTTLDT